MFRSTVPIQVYVAVSEILFNKCFVNHHKREPSLRNLLVLFKIAMSCLILVEIYTLHGHSKLFDI